MSKRLYMFCFLFVLILTGCTRPNELLITFNSNGGSSVSAITSDGKSFFTLPDNPTKNGFVFEGWYFDNQTFTQPFTLVSFYNLEISGNLTVYAKWVLEEVEQPSITFQVIFDSMGGTEILPIDVEAGGTLIIPHAVKEGYTLMGWYTSVNQGVTLDEKWSFINYKVNSNITLYAKWEINQYKIIFNTDGGTLLNPIYINYNDEINGLEQPTKIGHTFAGWGPEIPDTMPAEHITLTALWEINQYTIHYHIETIDPTSIVPLNKGDKISQISLGQNYSALITLSGRLFVWGNNSFGNLGDGTTTNRNSPIEITQNFGLQNKERITHIFLGRSHSAALTSLGRVFTWGYNLYGQLGDDTNTNRSMPVDITNNFDFQQDEKIIQMSLEYFHSIALTTSGRVFTWGYNGFGQLGDDTLLSKRLPVEITQRFNLSGSEKVLQVSLGYNHSAALTTTGRVFTWGSNIYGQLGDGTGINKYVPTDVTNEFILPLNVKIIEIASGFNHNSAISSSNQLFFWGDNQYGQLGDGTKDNKMIPTNITEHFDLLPNEIISTASLGGINSSALTSQGRLFVWGNNQVGQFGNLTTTASDLPIETTMHIGLETDEMIISTHLGYANTSILTSKGNFYICGSNAYGQLGDGTYQYKPMFIPLFRHFFDDTLEQIYDYDETIQIFDPISTGLIFRGWYLDKNYSIHFNETNMLDSDITLYGYWIIDNEQ
jgi:uncharacterized repeat protein (TIGR02543 family)